MASWAVFQDLRVGGRRRRRLRLVLVDVPDDARKGAVIAALEAAGHDAAFSDGGVAWANHLLLPESRWPAELEAGGDVTRTSWPALLGAQKTRAVSLDLAPGDYARLALAAARAGEQLYPWCRARLLEAAAAELLEATS